MFVLICTNTDNSIKMLYFKTEFWIFKIVIFPSNVDCCLIKAKVLVKIFLTRCNLRLIKIHLFYHWKNNRVTSFFSLCSFFFPLTTVREILVFVWWSVPMMLPPMIKSMLRVFFTAIIVLVPDQQISCRTEFSSVGLIYFLAT